MRRYSTRMTSVVLNIDIEPFLRNLRAAAQKAKEAMDTMAQSVKRMGEVWVRAREVRVAGLESRMYVRAGLDPGYATPAALHLLVRMLLRKPSAVLGLGDSMFLTREERCRLAAAAMRGWATHRSPERDAPSPLPWHRYMAGTRVQVA